MKSVGYVLKACAIACAFFILGRLTVFMLNLGLAAAPVWFPAGVALAALLWDGSEAGVGVLLGSLLLGLSLGATGAVAFVAALGTTLSAIAGQWLLRRVGWHPAFNSLRDAIRFLALAVVLSPTVNATISSFNACVAGLIAWSDFEQHWLAIWLGDGLGILVMAPLLLTWLKAPWLSHLALQALSPKALHRSVRGQGQKSQRSVWRSLEAVVWFVFLLGSSWAVFYTPVQPGVARYPLEYVPISLIVWASLRFGPRGTVLSSFVVSSAALWGLMAQKGPFLMDANDDVQQAVYLLQAFVGITAGTVLVLAAAVAEREQAEVQLRFAAERERLLAGTAQRIRRSLDLNEILNTTVAEVRQLLQADRVFITRLDLSDHTLAVAESVDPQWSSVLDWMSDEKVSQAIETLFKQEAEDQTHQPKPVRVIDDTDQVEKPPLIADHYRYCQVRASIGVPLMGCDKMFGLLLVNQCSGPRHWQPFEINLLEQLATQVEIAIQQGQLFQHLQTLTASLEEQVQERTAELQQRMQELQGLNQVKDVLLHAVAHDLRTPMQGMLMVLNNLRQKHCDIAPVPCAKLDRMIQSCDQQLNLLNSLLEDHTSERPCPAIDCQPITLQHVLEKTLASLEPLFASSQVTLHNHVPFDLPVVKADPLQLQCVFKSLLLNAVKHNPPGLTITLNASVSDRADSTSPPMLYCTVTDDGTGMSQPQCDRLFQLYVRGVDNQHLTGIGLGLYRCRQIIAAHGGTIGVNSHPGKGSQFWFTLPF